MIWVQYCEGQECYCVIVFDTHLDSKVTQFFYQGHKFLSNKLQCVGVWVESCAGQEWVDVVRLLSLVGLAHHHHPSYSIQMHKNNTNIYN